MNLQRCTSPTIGGRCCAVRSNLLEANGWVETVGGEHVVKAITLPANKRRDYPPGLRAAILRQAGLLGEEEP